MLLARREPPALEGATAALLEAVVVLEALGAMEAMEAMGFMGATEALGVADTVAGAEATGTSVATVGPAKPHTGSDHR